MQPFKYHNMVIVQVVKGIILKCIMWIREWLYHNLVHLKLIK